VLELAGALDALQDVLVGDDAVPDQLNGSAGEVSQVVVQDGLFIKQVGVSARDQTCSRSAACVRDCPGVRRDRDRTRLRQDRKRP
jgi:hypothetical protein